MVYCTRSYLQKHYPDAGVDATEYGVWQKEVKIQAIAKKFSPMY